MGWLMAALYDPFMREVERKRFQGWRRELLAGLSGEVLEVGAGTGANLPHYPEAVQRLVITEPDPAMRRQLSRRLDEGQACGRGVVELSDAPLPGLPFADGRFDAVVATLVLCSVPDPERALADLRRVLRPGGRLVFLEHVAADNPKHRIWQGRIEPVWRRIAGNCHLTRETEAAIASAGFSFERVVRHVERRGNPLLRQTVRGVARAGTLGP